MTAQEILEELRPLGKPGYKRTMMKNHGVKEPFFGVPISELQKIRKRIKTDHRLALDLYATGNYDAMYLAGMIADDTRMTRAELRDWAAKAYGGALAGATVPSVATGSPFGWELAQEWIDSAKPRVAAIGWATLASLVSVKPDADLDLPALWCLAGRVRESLHGSPDPVRYQMNNFLLCLGGYVTALTAEVLVLADAIGPVTADLGNNACQVPSIRDYLLKMQERGVLGKKRKSAKC